MKTKNLVLVLALAAVAAGTAYWARQHFSAAPAQEQAAQGGGQGGGQVAEVGVVTIQPQSVVFTKDLPGRTSAVRVAEIRPQVSGIIIKRLFEEGSDVTEGQQLYQIDPAPYQAAFESAQADLLKAQANSKSVQAKSSRYAELVKIGGISQQEYDDVRANLAQNNADVAIANAALVTAKINLDYTKVLSPIAGRIGQSSVTEGALVTANQAAALATVQQMDKIYVDVTQSSEELMRLRRQFAETAPDAVKPSARLLIDGKVFGEPGELQFSDVTVNQTTGTVLLRILFQNPNNEILPGLFVHARLEQSRDEAAILVSQKAVTRNADGGTTVWVVGPDNKVSVRPIKVSDAQGDQWRVTEGLQAGDRVVVEGTMKVGPDAVVKPVEIQSQAAAEQQAAPDQPAQVEIPAPQAEDSASAEQIQPEQAEDVAPVVLEPEAETQPDASAAQ